MHQRIDTSGSDHDVASWIWRNLVPASGQSDTIQGELLRAVEKLRWEAQNNGNINWDDGFIMLLDFLEAQLCGDAAVSEHARSAIVRDLARLRAYQPPDANDDALDSGTTVYVDDDLYDRLTTSVVAFARARPELVRHVPNPALRR